MHLKRLDVGLFIADLEKQIKDLGYARFDRIDTSKATFEQKSTFARWHYHTDDEVRFCVATSSTSPATFEFKSEVGITICRVVPGDFLVIPAGTLHRFYGDGEFVRLFKESVDWTPYFL